MNLNLSGINNDELMATLPKLLRELADVTDLQTTMRLVDWRGGRALYVPAIIGIDHPITSHLGSTAAQWLIQNYAGENIRVDRAAATLRYLRNQEMFEHSESGNKSLNTLAEEYDLTQRQVLSILKSLKTDPTPDLFS